MDDIDIAELAQRPIQPNRAVAVFFTLVTLATTVVAVAWKTESRLYKNWFITVVIAASLLVTVFWAIPSWAPRINRYLWTPSKNVSVTYSASVALASYFLAILVCIVLFFIAFWQYPSMTEYWGALWSIALISALAPILIGIYLLLEQAGATRSFKWLSAARFLTHPTKKDQFNDRGRLFVMAIALIEICMIQGGIVLTGGLSVSPFNVLLVSVGTVAAIASERPVYAIFTVVMSALAGVATEVVGSYEPPARTFYPEAHIVIFLLSMMLGLLVDLGRKLKPTPQRSNKRKPKEAKDES